MTDEKRKSAQISIRVSLELRLRLEAIAERKGMKMATYITNVLNNAVMPIDRRVEI